MFGQPEAAIGLAPWPIAPHAAEAVGEQLGQLGAVQLEQVIDVAAGAAIGGVAMNA